MRQYLTFELDGRRYGVLVEHVNSVLDPQMITPLPHGSTIVTGLTNVRGNVVPVFDPRETLQRTKVDDIRIAKNVNKPDSEHNPASREEENDEEGGIVIFEVENGTLLPFIGLQADKIGKVINLEDSEISSVPDFLPENASKFFEGFCFVGDTRHSIISLKELASKESLFSGGEGGRRA
ncbi:MAG: chemotaxis protein CheW [Spirochaetes bacterium]|nr:chemotaxis protein CheW [Spirochaetota bacterium]MBU1082162.1 chemotaxis protein CheW [Spirochaetota bacterium]